MLPLLQKLTEVVILQKGLKVITVKNHVLPDSDSCCLEGIACCFQGNRF